MRTKTPTKHYVPFFIATLALLAAIWGPGTWEQNANTDSEPQRFNLVPASPDQSYWNPAVYRNEEYGFEVRYPQNWRYEENDSCGENCIGFTDDHSHDWKATIIVHDSPYSETKKRVIAGINPQIDITDVEQDYLINEIPWIHLRLQEGRTRIIEGYFTERQGKTFEVHVPYPMLLTFKFKNN